MRSGFIILLMATLLFGGGYFYYVAQAVCPAPLAYSIGEVDESFDISFDEVRLALSDAESVWEDATGRNLFIYDEHAKFKVNFIYDDRQAYTDAEGSFKDKLDQTQNVSDSISGTYTQLVASYNNLQIVYSDNVDQYQKKLATYNEQVTRYNEDGGVTEAVYAVLEDRKDALDTKQKNLDNLSKQLNTLVDQINKIGDQGNLLVETYNRGVNEYNQTFGDSREFTQGTYSSDKRIDIYSYIDKNELRIVLAHEFGHSLSLDHVTNEKSVMYFLIGKQPKGPVLSVEDITEFNNVCGTKSIWDTIRDDMFKK